MGEGDNYTALTVNKTGITTTGVEVELHINDGTAEGMSVVQSSCIRLCMTVQRPLWIEMHLIDIRILNWESDCNPTSVSEVGFAD